MPEPSQLRVDPDFTPGERLFRRVPVSEVLKGEVSDLCLPSPDFSVNREKYCSEICVASLWHGQGILSLDASNVTQQISDESGRFDLRLAHDPCKENYSHSAVSTYREGVAMGKKAPSHIRKKFRDLLRRGSSFLPLSGPALNQTGLAALPLLGPDRP
jgi:hypothetical protein